MYISDQWKIPVSCRDYWRDIYFPTFDAGNLSINPKYSGTSLPQCFLAEMYSLWMGFDSVGGTVTRSVWGHMKNSHTNNDTSVIWFGSERAQSKHQCPVHLQWNHLTLKLNHRKHITYGKVCLQCGKCDAKECRILEVAKCCRYLLQTSWCNQANLLVFHKFQ